MAIDTAIIIAIVSIIGLIVTLIFNINTSRTNTNARLASLMNEIIRENYTLYREESKLQSEEEFFIHAQSYFDFMNRVAYLCLNEKIPKEIGAYLKGYFVYVQQWMDWYNDVPAKKMELRPVEKDWPDIEKWCKEIGIWQRKNDIRCTLPNKLLKIWKPS